jgi:hypothetical protein
VAAQLVGLRQAARQLGIHRDARKAAFTQWGLPALARQVGWQPSHFLADRAEAERDFALAEQLGSVKRSRVYLQCAEGTSGHPPRPIPFLMWVRRPIRRL